jgi:hypothetical protein
MQWWGPLFIAENWRRVRVDRCIKKSRLAMSLRLSRSLKPKAFKAAAVAALRQNWRKSNHLYG